MSDFPNLLKKVQQLCMGDQYVWKKLIRYFIMDRKLRSIIQLLTNLQNLPSMSNILIARYRAYNNSTLQLNQYSRTQALSTLKTPQNNPVQPRPPSNGNSYFQKYDKFGPTTSSNILKEHNQHQGSRQYFPSYKISFANKQKITEIKKEKDKTQSYLGFRQINHDASKNRLFGGCEQNQNKTPTNAQKIAVSPNNGNFPNTKQNIRASEAQIAKKTQLTTKNLGLTGLENIGNTCYMNSILQCLFNLPQFNDYFLANQYSKEFSNQSRVAQSYAKLLYRLRNSSKKSQNPAELKMAISSKKTRFSGYAQQDAQQFLAGLLEQMSLDLNRSRNPKYKELTADLSKQTLEEISEDWWNYNKSRENSIVSDFFAGQLLSRVVCCRCKHQSIAFDNSWDFPLNFTSSDQGDLLRMLQNFLKEETLNNDYYCSKCKDFRQCKRKVDFYRLPKILVLQLKRFSYGKYSKQKINAKVKVPTQLNLSKLIYQSKHCSKSCSYQLVGLVHHSGDIDFGHYTAECRNPINGNWYTFNDSSVTPSIMKDYLQSSSPYLLFFAKH